MSLNAIFSIAYNMAHIQRIHGNVYPKHTTGKMKVFSDVLHVNKRYIYIWFFKQTI